MVFSPRAFRPMRYIKDRPQPAQARLPGWTGSSVGRSNRFAWGVFIISSFIFSAFKTDPLRRRLRLVPGVGAEVGKSPVQLIGFNGPAAQTEDPVLHYG